MNNAEKKCDLCRKSTELFKSFVFSANCDVCDKNFEFDYKILLMHRGLKLKFLCEKHRREKGGDAK